MQWSLTFFQGCRLDELYATYLALLTEKTVVQICASTQFVELKYILCEFYYLVQVQLQSAAVQEAS